MVLEDQEERVPTVGPLPERETRRNGFGQGGFMSPMRRVAEAAHRVPEVQDINIVETPRGHPNISITNQWSEGRDLIPELSQPIEEILLSTAEQQPSVREDTIREPKVVVEHVPLLNGGPPTSQEGSRATIASTVATTTFTTTTGTIPMESVSLSSTPQVSSTGMEEGVPQVDLSA